MIKLIFFIAALLSLNASAACEGKGTVFYFGNGMFNTQEDAIESLNALKALVLTSIPLDPKKKQEFRLAYKESEPFFEQLSNVFYQKGVDDYEAFWLWIGNVEPAPNWFKKAALSLAEESLRDFKGFEDLSQHVTQYGADFHRGFQIIVVSHSQGNLYANRAAEALSRWPEWETDKPWNVEHKPGSPLPNLEDVFAVVQIATPASRTAMNAPWTTYAGDLVMNFVRETTTALPANVPFQSGSNADWTGHSFTETYLKVPSLRTKILADIRAAHARLKYPLADDQTALSLIRGTDDDRQPDLLKWAHVSIDGILGSANVIGPSEDEFQGRRIENHHISCRAIQTLGEIHILANASRLPSDYPFFDFRAFNGDWQSAKPLEGSFFQSVDLEEPYQYWRLARLTVKNSESKEPFEIVMNFPKAPERLSEQEWEKIRKPYLEKLFKD